MTEVDEVIGGRYRLERLLGRGGMAAVWVGRDLILDRLVAIKKLAAAGLDEPMAFERFEQEARAVAQLTHPNVVAVHDYGTDGGEPYLVMELVAGQTVAAMLDDGPLTITQAVAIAAQTCDGLAAAHAAGIVHRDIKPGNLIVTPGGVVKICDFGIARMLDSGGQASSTGETTAVGSAAYMAPERVDDQPIDHRVDLYSLGCTLYAMLTGTPPFAGGTPIATLQLHLTRAPTPVGELRSDVPPNLESLIDDLLEKAPTARPADATQVRDRLLACLPGGVPAAGDPPLTAVPQAAAAAGAPRPRALGPTPDTTERLQADPASSGRRYLVAAAALAGLLIVAASMLAWSQRTAEPTGETAVVAAPSPTPTPLPTSTPTPTPTPTPQAPAPTSAPPAVRSTAAVAAPPPVDPVAAIRVSIQVQVDTGNLTPPAAADLFKRVDEIAREANEGDLAETTKKINEFRRKLTELLDDGKLTTAGQDELNSRLDAVEAALT